MVNSKSERSNTGYKGIGWRKDHGKFQAKVSVGHDKAQIHIGEFDTLKEAINARVAFIKSLF